MPIYEFTCEKCEHDFEELVFGEQKPACPNCGSIDTHKHMSRCARVKSGSGACEGTATGGNGGGCSGCSGGNCSSCGM